MLIRNKNLLWQPIRLRRSAIQDLRPFIVGNPKEFDRERDTWNRDGGMMIYDRGFGVRENIAAHHAQLVSECPPSMEDLRDCVQSARELVVIYRPPSWDEHIRWVQYTAPNAEICRNFFNLARSAATNEKIGAALNINEPFTVCSDASLCDALKIRIPQLWRIRDSTLRYRDWKMITRVVPRIAPPDQTLADVYHFILRECSEVDGEYLIVGSALAKAARFWKVALRRLEIEGAIERRETVFCYLLSGLPPDWEAIELAHLRKRATLDKITTFVDGLPELEVVILIVWHYVYIRK